MKKPASVPLYGDILRNPFVLLGVEPTASNQDILDAAEERIDDDPSLEAELTSAKQLLLNPRIRIKSEISSFIDIPIEQGRYFIVKLRLAYDHNSIRAELGNLPPLSRCNLLTHLAIHSGADADLLTQFVNSRSSISLNTTIASLEAIRKLAGIIRPDPALVRDGLYHLGERQTRAIFGSYRQSQDAIDDTGACAARILLEPDDARTEALDNLLRGYRQRVNSDLARKRQDIDTASEKLRRDPQDARALDQLTQALRDWNRFGEPLQLLESYKGRDEPEARAIYESVRSLSVEIANQHSLREVSLAITRVSSEVFSRLPRAKVQLDDERELLERLVQDEIKSRERQVLQRSIVEYLKNNRYAEAIKSIKRLILLTESTEERNALYRLKSKLESKPRAAGWIVSAGVIFVVAAAIVGPQTRYTPPPVMQQPTNPRSGLKEEPVPPPNQALPQELPKPEVLNGPEMRPQLPRSKAPADPQIQPFDNKPRSVRIDLLRVEEASRVQRRLTALGFFVGPANGIWGPQSRAALRWFKTTNDLSDDDILDSQTSDRLFAAEVARATHGQPPSSRSVPETLYPPRSGLKLNPLNRADAVRINGRLRELGFFKGKNDGLWSGASRVALHDFKVKNGLAPDDVWDEQSESILFGASSH